MKGYKTPFGQTHTLMNLKIISAGAGSGKTYTLTNEMADLLTPKAPNKAAVRASGIIATTFTNKAAAELKERVRIQLLERGLSTQADELGNAMIGTVHAIGVQLLKRFAFEAGVSPNVDIIADSDHQSIFNQSLSTVLAPSLIQRMNQLSERLGFYKSAYTPKDWRKEMRNLVNVARSNNFDAATLEESKNYSINSFLELLPPVSDKPAAYFDEKLSELIQTTLTALYQNEDKTKSKQSLISKLKGMQNALRNKGFLNWYEWAAIGKMKAPKKSRDDFFDLQEFVKKHSIHPDFRGHIIEYVSHIFDSSMAAIREYQSYKKTRGLIDYTDMEVMILELLENDLVLEVLGEEIDLLLVDEFQDTNPIQLKIFLKLTQIAKQAIWVGDPKQSIYGFRGAAPDLMEAVMNSTNNIANLPKSWRSRSDLVHLVNGLFVEAFDNMPAERVALIPEYTKDKEPPELGAAAHHWHFQFEGNRSPAKPWTERCIARSIAEVLTQNWSVRIKGSKQLRPMVAADIAVLCRSNNACQTVATALYQEGLKASIARNGLLNTAEARLLMAAMRYILNKHDALSIAEVLLLTSQADIENIINNRLEYLTKVNALAEKNNSRSNQRWGHDNDYIQLLRTIRHQSKELSASEILNWLIERLDVRRTVAAWSNSSQRLANIDALRKLALDYEESCNRLHSAASLGGFLLWLDDLASNEQDAQGSGEGSDAVRVLTYHKSKGLEWPMVICHSLDNKMRDNIWGIRIVRQSEKIDINHPLANRLICYWVNPYDDQIKNTALEETVKEQPAFSQARKEALAEEARILYVGLTRARDYLILPTVQKKETKWLNRVYHHGNESLPTLDIHSNELMWLWQNKLIPIQNKLFNYEKNMAAVVAKEQNIRYLYPRKGSQKFEAAQIEHSDLWNPSYQLVLEKKHCYAKAVVLKEEEIDYLEIQTIFKTFILADNPQNTKDIRQKMAEELIKQFELEQEIKPQDLLYHSKAFYHYLTANFGTYDWQKHYKFIQKKEARFLALDLDLVGQNNNSVLVINSLNQSIPKLAQNKSKIKEDAAILHTVALGLCSSLGYPNNIQLIWQPLEGILTSIRIESKAKQGVFFE